MRADIALLTLVAGSARFLNLGRQLWSDEITALLFTFRTPFSDYAASNPSFVPHPLYELMAFAGIKVFGEEAWVIRLPAALFGIGTVLLVYLFARKVSDRGEALLTGGLLAVFYNHVFYSQDARGYSTMLFFFMLSSLMLLDLRRLKPWQAVVFVISSAFASLAVVFGSFALAGHSLTILVAAWWWKRRGSQPSMSPRAAMVLVGAAGVTTVTLYLPWLADIARVATQASSQIETGQRMQPALIPELLEGLRAGLGGPGALAAGMIVGVLGVVSYLRRNSFAAAVLLLPVMLNVGVLIILGAAVHPRFVLLALPAGVVLGARGLRVVWGAVSGVSARVGIQLPKWAPFAAALFLLVAVAYPLIRYYELPKQDFQGGLRVATELAGPEDHIVGVTIAGHVIRDYYRPGFSAVETLDDLREIEDRGGGVWVIATLERALRQSQPDLLTYLESDYRLVRELPGTLDGGEVKVYVGEGDLSEDPT